MPTAIFGAYRRPDRDARGKSDTVRCIESHRNAVLRISRALRAQGWVCAATAFGILLAFAADPVSAASSTSIAMHGQPALAADFPHMPYANPDAPKGGRLVQGILGTFDSLNPLIVRGVAVQQGAAAQQMRGLVIESLMARGNDEAFTLYGLLTRSVETDDTRSYVTFHIDPRARFSD